MRRYDLDWLRVIVFGLLIFYHVGMFFVPWGWHIKNNEIYDWLRYPMLFVNQWRLPILFVISGMGTAYALQQRNAWQFIGERCKRLLIPLIFGMLVVVPPQVYFERLSQGQFSGSYFDFWPDLAFEGVYPTGNLSWHHLWFLPYLLCYSILLTPVFIYLRNHPESRLLKQMHKLAASPARLYLLILPLYLLESLVEPFFKVTHNLTNDWFTFSNFLLLFLYGFLLISVKESFWNTVKQYRRNFLIIGLSGFSLMISIRLIFADSTPVHFIEALFKVTGFWSWILALIGYAAQYLSHNSRILTYSNRAVYPFYILHQSITITIGYYLKNLDWGLLPKASIMVLGTFLISWLFYEFLIRRIRLLRLLFGIK